MKKNSKKIRIFSALEVANICGVVNQTAVNWIKAGHLQAFTTPGGQYRVYFEDLYKFLNSRNMQLPDDLKELVGTVPVKTICLVIDDDKILSDTIKSILEKSIPELEIHQAFDGFEAGRALYELEPKLVILDIDLPGVNGHEICKKIKKEERLNNPVIVSISGLTSEDGGERILKEGADAFIEKPFDFDKFIFKIKELIG